MPRDFPMSGLGTGAGHSPRHVLVGARGAVQGRVNQQLIEDVPLKGQPGSQAPVTWGGRRDPPTTTTAAGRPVLRDKLPGGVKGKDTPTLSAQSLGEAGAAGPQGPSCGRGWRPEAHLGVAAPDLDDPVADGQEQLDGPVGVPVLNLHQGLAQGQPHVAGQEVLTVLPWGPARGEGALSGPPHPSAPASPPGSGRRFLSLASPARHTVGTSIE